MSTNQIVHVISHLHISTLWRFFLGAAGAFGAHAPNWARPDLAFGSDFASAESAILAEVGRVNDMAADRDKRDVAEHGPAVPRATFQGEHRDSGETCAIRFGTGRTFVELLIAVDGAVVVIGISCSDDEMVDPVGARANAHIRFMAGHKAAPLFDASVADMSDRIAAARESQWLLVFERDEENAAKNDGSRVWTVANVNLLTQETRIEFGRQDEGDRDPHRETQTRPATADELRAARTGEPLTWHGGDRFSLTTTTSPA